MPLTQKAQDVRIVFASDGDQDLQQLPSHPMNVTAKCHCWQWLVVFVLGVGFGFGVVGSPCTVLDDVCNCSAICIFVHMFFSSQLNHSQ